MGGRRNSASKRAEYLWWKRAQARACREQYGSGPREPLVIPSTSSSGYLIIHVVQSLCGVMLMYSLVLPILHHQGLEMLRGLAVGV